jgi:hypothetical protein
MELIFSCLLNMINIIRKAFFLYDFQCLKVNFVK